MKKITRKLSTKEYSVIDLGSFTDIENYTFQPKPDFKIDGKVFVKDALDMTSSEISFNTMLPNTAIPFIHKHKENEEIYIVIKGNGQLLLNDAYIDLKEGSVVRVATDTERAIRNNSDAIFTFIVIQAKENSLKESTISDGFGIEKKPNWK